MFWKSTAIFVHATSSPRTGRGARPVHASADRMSEAVNSAGLSGGTDIKRESSRIVERSVTDSSSERCDAVGFRVVRGDFLTSCARFSHTDGGTQANLLF